jgi:hypothetical protein
VIGHALPDLAHGHRVARSWFEEYVFGIASLPASDAGPSDLAVRQQLHCSAEYRQHVLGDTFEEERRQARTARLPGNLSALHDLAFQALKAVRFGNIACSTTTPAPRPAPEPLRTMTITTKWTSIGQEELAGVLTHRQGSVGGIH